MKSLRALFEATAVDYSSSVKLGHNDLYDEEVDHPLDIATDSVIPISASFTPPSSSSNGERKRMDGSGDPGFVDGGEGGEEEEEEEEGRDGNVKKRKLK